MKRRAPVAAILAALPLGAALMVAGCSGDDSRTFQGYVEGTYVYIAPDAMGRLITRPATDGARVAAGATLFTLDDADQKAAVAGAEARLAQAKAELANLQTGERPEEISVLAANLSSARATFANAQDNYRRQLQLRQNGNVAQSVVDAAEAATGTASAQVDAAERQLDVARLPARPDQIDAAQRNVNALAADLDQAETALARRTLAAPAAGFVEETYYEPGELVAAGQPVVSLLPDANRKVRFFVPERMLARVNIGSTVSVSCDGCAAGLTATVEFVSSAAEFTPPIIYSKDSRDKLVFRVDARPEGDANGLKVGQPLDVRLGAAK
jgi:HlyD family secretion protein